MTIWIKHIWIFSSCVFVGFIINWIAIKARAGLINACKMNSVRVLALHYWIALKTWRFPEQKCADFQQIALILTDAFTHVLRAQVVSTQESGLMMIKHRCNYWSSHQKRGFKKYVVLLFGKARGEGVAYLYVWAWSDCPSALVNGPALIRPS